MAIDEHLAAFEKGHVAWTQWRAANPDIQPDLSKTPLHFDDALEWDLSKCRLEECVIDCRGGAGASLRLDCSDAQLPRACFAEGSLITRLSLTPGSVLTGTDFSKVTLVGVDFAVDQMLEAKFFQAKLERVTFRGELRGLNFNRSTLADVTFTDCILHQCQMQTASVANARFDSAVFHAGGNGKGSSLDNAAFRQCSFRDADLGGSGLKGTSFVACDLTRVTGVVGDDTLFLDTVRSSDSGDSWSALSRRYTGTNMVLNLLLLVVFFLPQILHAVYLTGVNEVQTAALRAATLALSDVAQMPEGAAKDRLERLAHDLEPRGFKECVGPSRGSWLQPPAGCMPLWQILLGIDESWVVAAVSGLLMLYNVLRLLLTVMVGRLRDEEGRSQHTPALGRYRWMSGADRLVRTLSYLALGAAAWHLVPRLFTPIWVGGV